MPDEKPFVILPLQEHDRQRLSAFGQAVLRSSHPPEQENYCRKASRQLSVGDFPFIYAGVLLSTRGRVVEAMRLFSFVRGNAFVSALTKYLVERKSFHLSSHFFRSVVPLDAWTRTAISHSEMRTTVDAFVEFACADGRLIKRKPFSVLDIGTGTGVLLAQLVNRLAMSYKTPTVRLFLLDSSAELLRTAATNCHRLISIPCEVVAIRNRVESLGKTVVSALKKSDITFATAASCLHHLPEEQKISTLSLLRTISPVLLLEELEANHDLPDEDSPELIWSVQRFYDSLIGSVLKSKLSAKSKQACINDFLLAEAVTIVANAKKDRGNYHTLLDQWVGIARAGGFQVVGVKTRALNKCGLRTLTLILKSGVL